MSSTFWYQTNETDNEMTKSSPRTGRQREEKKCLTVNY